MPREKLDPAEKQRRKLARIKAWQLANPDRVRASQKKHKAKRRQEDPEGLRAEQAQYQARYRERYPEQNAARKAKWAEDNKDHLRQYKANWMRTAYSEDEIYRLSMNLRRRLSSAFTSQGLRKTDKTFVLTGCSIPELIAHLSARFTEGMTLENYGEWVIDHIVPVGAFNLHDPLHRVICFHYSNLQPLWRADNLRKVKRDKALIAAARLAQSRL